MLQILLQIYDGSGLVVLAINKELNISLDVLHIK